MTLKTNRKSIIIKCIFFLYLLVLIRIVIFKYPVEHLRSVMEEWSADVFWQGLPNSNFTFFKTIRMYITYWGRINSFENLVGNVAIFVPFGILYPVAFEKGKHFFSLSVTALCFILGLELVQMWTNFGAFDVDDILLNYVGTVLGYFIYFFVRKLFVRET